MKDKVNLSIRKFQSNDILDLTDLTNELGYPTTIEQMTLRMKAIIHLDNYWTFVAELNSRVVGYIGLNLNHFWEQDGYFIRIQALVVKKEYRRLGIGQKLIEQSEILARQVGAKLILLNCGNRDERKSAHSFYP